MLTIYLLYMLGSTFNLHIHRTCEGFGKGAVCILAAWKVSDPGCGTCWLRWLRY